MKKIIMLCAALGLSVMPLSASVNFYRASNGHLVWEGTDCQSVFMMKQLVSLPDDPPGTDDEEPTEEPTGQTTGVSPDVTKGAQTIIGAVLGDEDTPKRNTSFHDISNEELAFTEATDFYERQEELLTYVRDVNWKTGLQITWRDFSFFRRLKMVCSGVNQLTKPMRVEMESFVGSLDETIEKSADEGVDKLAQAVRGHSFAAMTRLSLVGMADAIDQINPFLLLTLDEDTYNKLVESNPKIAELFEDMYVFFKIRALGMESIYDKNTKELIRIAKIGKGDSFNTWHVLSEYAKKMLELNRAGKLTVSDEKEIHLWKLESSMYYVAEQVRIERRAAQLAAQDPNNASLVQEVKEGTKKKPSLDDRARELLQRSTQDEIKQLIQKYIAK